MHFLARLINLRMKKRISDETGNVILALCDFDGTKKIADIVDIYDYWNTNDYSIEIATNRVVT